MYGNSFNSCTVLFGRILAKKFLTSNEIKLAFDGINISVMFTTISFKFLISCFAWNFVRSIKMLISN